MTATATAPAKTIVELMASAALVIGAVSKNLRNEQAGYAARSIDDILDAVHTPLATLGIVVIPRVVSRVTEQRQSRGGGALYYVALEVEYTFHGPDGDSLAVVVWGEAMDSSDKASNKAMSAALKMALIQSFSIPVVGQDGDADRHTHEAVNEPQAVVHQIDELGARLELIWLEVGRRAYPKEPGFSRD